MKGKEFYLLIGIVLFVGMLIFSTGAGAAETGASLVGQQVTNFSLSSTQNRLVNYGQEYYGKHHLIITFFPAAFTPV